MSHTARSSSRAAGGGANAPPKKLLIVDDVALMGEGIRRAVRSSGYESVVIDNGQEALQLVEKLDFDLVLTDLRMPAMSGEELIDRLYELAPELPCIVVTGYLTKDALTELVGKPNVADILVKPWQWGRLLSAVSAVIGKHRGGQVEEHPDDQA
jgi:CheY-like chemotaxis protein